MNNQSGIPDDVAKIVLNILDPRNRRDSLLGVAIAEAIMAERDRKMTQDVCGFLYALLGSDTWIEAGMVWDGNPDERKAAYNAISRQLKP